MFPFKRTPPPQTADDQLATIRAHSEQARQATELRNRAIRSTRGRSGPTLEEVAQAAGLTVSRVKQIRSTDEFQGHRGADRAPITDLDLPVLDSDSPNRVWGIMDIAPEVSVFESERAFFAAGRSRYGSDLGWDYYDVDREQRFVISTAGSPDGGVDIYAFAADRTDGKAHTPQGFIGSSSGPCYLLGTVPNSLIVDEMIFPPLLYRVRRPGALAWAYMRIRTITEVLNAMEQSQGGWPEAKARRFLSAETPSN